MARGRAASNNGPRVLRPREPRDPLVQLGQQAQVDLRPLQHLRGGAQVQGARLRPGLRPTRGRRQAKLNKSWNSHLSQIEQGKSERELRFKSRRLLVLLLQQNWTLIVSLWSY